MLKVALAQMEVIPGRPDLNTKTMLAMMETARSQQAQLIVFPEMAIPGYLLGDTWEQQAFLRDCEDFGRQIIAASGDLCVIFGNVGVDWQKSGDDGRVRKYNAFFVAQNGQLRGGTNFPYPFRIKTLQPNYREFDDTRHFYSLRKLALEMDTRVEDLLQPVGLEIGGSQLQARLHPLRRRLVRRLLHQAERHLTRQRDLGPCNQYLQFALHPGEKQQTQPGLFQAGQGGRRSAHLCQQCRPAKQRQNRLRF